MSALTEGRAVLFESLTTVFVQPVNGVQFAGRVHRTPPAQLAAPSVWIGDTLGSLQTNRGGAATVYRVAWPVRIVVNGSTTGQSDLLDELIVRVVDAVFNADGFTTVEHRPFDTSVLLPANSPSTPTLRGVEVIAETTLRALTLVNPPLMEAASA